jgi:hypothetical protein
MAETTANLITAKELAARFGNRKAPRTLVEHAKKGWIPAVLLGKTWMFDYDDVLAAMKQNAKPQ